MAEWEMSTHQRGLIDTCLEEGQYESAIAILAQLRSPTYKPSPRHIRQLIYIALHTTTASLPNENAGDSPPSPGLSKNTLLVPPAAVVAARRLLVSFASTNSPQVVARALPRYPDHHESNILLAEDVGDSAIAVESMSLSGSKSCWNILAEGFIHRTRQMLPTPKGKGKQCTERADHKPVSMAENPNVVGDDAWPVLEWLLLLFERDELLTEAFGSPRHSPLLINQIPPPRNDMGSRWEIDLPLSIIFFCFQQSDMRRRRMGSRLMTLLINLSSTTHLDFPMLVASVYSCLVASSLVDFPTLFSNIEPSPVSSHFKIALCQKFLANVATKGNSTRMDTHSKPQARVQPRALRLAHAQSRNERTVKASTLPPMPPTPSKLPLPTFADLIGSMETNIKGLRPPATTSLLLRIKFNLMASYGILQAQSSEMEKDRDWVDAVRNGTLGKSLELVFGSHEGDEARFYKESLESMMSMW